MSSEGWEGGFWLAGSLVSSLLPHPGWLLQGLVLADYNSVASHFRWI